MTLAEIIAKLVELFNANGDEVVTALQTSAQPVYQRIFDKGHSTGLTKGRDEKKTTDAEVTRLTSELETANASLTELRSKTPDVQKVTEQFQTEIRDIKEKHKGEIKAERERSREIEINRQMTLLKTKLEKKVNPLYAKLLTQDLDIRKRIHPKDDGAVEVMQAGKEIPFSPAEGQDPIDLLVDELVKAAPTDYRLAEGDEGSGVQNGPAGAPRKTSFDKIRENKQKELKGKETGTEGIKSLDEKLGVTRTA